MFSPPLIQLHAVHVKVFSETKEITLERKFLNLVTVKTPGRVHCISSCPPETTPGSPRVLKNSLIYAILVLLHVAPHNELMH